MTPGRDPQQGGGATPELSDEPSGWACCWDDPSGQYPFHLTHSQRIHSPIVAGRPTMVLAFANSVVCRWQARGYARDASHVRSRFMATAPHQPCPSLVHLQRQRLLLPRNVARMACSEVAWPAMTERLRGAGPPPRPRIILSHITILDGGASLLATGGSGSPSPPLPRNVTSRPAASVSLGLQSESALPTCRRHLSVSCGPWCEKCKALLLQPAHPGGTTMVGDHTTARQVCRRTSGDEFRARTGPLPAAAHRADLAATHAENPVKTRHMVAPEPCVSSSGIVPPAPVAIGPPHHDRAVSPAHWGPAERWRVL